VNSYETTLILSPELPPEAIETLIDKVKKILSKDGSTVSLLENEGVKKLSYPIDGRSEGCYIYAEYKAGPAVLVELENFLHLSDAVIRHLSVAKEKPSKIKPAAPRRPRPEPVSSPVSAPAPVAKPE
jgi:small subunit ribosomal protein S6